MAQGVPRSCPRRGRQDLAGGSGSFASLSLSPLTIDKAVLHLSSDSSNELLYAEKNSTDPAGMLQRFRKARGSAANRSIVDNGDSIGSLVFQGYDGASFLNVAQIIAKVDGAPGSNVMPGRIGFLTTPPDSATLTERMRITSSGNVGIGTTNPQRLLHVSGVNTDIFIDRSAITNDARVIFPVAGNPVAAGAWGAGVYADGANSKFVIASSSNFVAPLTISQNGNVGIGMESPETLLHVGSSGALKIGTRLVADSAGCSHA
ncbi:MAG: hypothetical protein HYY04_09890 [Chloroflexi bacterium]|nr:hypothetical protein [Chloroflexota bacterium]